MAKGNLTQKDLMIWTMDHPNGTKFYYVIEKEPFQNEGFKKSVHRVGSNHGDAVFRYLDQAEAELAQWPPGEEEKPAEAVPAEAADPGGAPVAADGENESKEQAEASPKAPAPEAGPAAEAVNPKAYPEESGTP
ncbi:MAG: hypothetical protein JWN15_2622, partial [Firmicutes bacterium]|nr:hypothetical protein [Bacillota bacterium]